MDGVDGVYIGPSDLGLAAVATGRIPGIHTESGAVARRRVEQGFTFVSVAGDLVHPETAARDHLAAARG